MASQVVVEWDTASTPPRRHVVKTTPTMPLKAVMDSACRAFGLEDSSSRVQGLRYRRDWVDLSLPMRFANLPQGAKLQLIVTDDDAPTATRSPTTQQQQQSLATVVRIAVQVEDGSRVTGQYPCTTTLWEILLDAERQSKGNLTRREKAASTDKSVKRFSLRKMMANVLSGPPAVVYVQPVFVILNREFGTIPMLQETTLKSLGIVQGSQAIRLLFKETDVALAEVLSMMEMTTQSAVTETKQEIRTLHPVVDSIMEPEPAVSSSSINEPRSGPQIDTTPATTVIAPDATPNETASMDRDLKVFRLNAQVSAAKIDLPDSFFQLSAAEMRYAVSLQAKRRKELEDRPLMTRAMREREQHDRERKHPKTIIRVRFPDMLHLQGTFISADENVADLYSFVRANLVAECRDFYLYTTPPMRRLEGDVTMQQNFHQAGLAPASLVYFGSQSAVPGSCLLRDEVVQLCQETPLHPSLQEWVPDSSEVSEDTAEIVDAGNSVPAHSNNHSSSNNRDDTNDHSLNNSNKDLKVPKWFKMPLRK